MTVQRRGGHVRSQGHRGGVAIGQVLRPVLVFHGRFRIASEKGRKAGDVKTQSGLSSASEVVRGYASRRGRITPAKARTTSSGIS